MNQKLIETGIAVLHRAAPAGGMADAASELVEQALAHIDLEALPVRGALLFATPDWCETPDSLPRAVREQLRARLHHQVPLIGCSSSRLYCSTTKPTFFNAGVILILFCSNDLWVSVKSLPEPYSYTAKQRREKLNAMAKDLEQEAGTRLGLSAYRSLFGLLPGIFTDERGRRVYLDNELHTELLTAFGYKHRFYGASASHGDKIKSAYQFADDDCLTSGLVVALLQSDLFMGALTTHGFRGTNVRVSIDEVADADEQGRGYEVTKLDGKPVLERLQELREARALKFDKPIFGLPYGADYNIYWPLTQPDGNDDRLVMKRRVHLGDRLFLLDASPSEMIKAAGKAFEGTFWQAQIKPHDLNFFLCFTCGGRGDLFAQLAYDWQKRVNTLEQDYPGVPIIAVFSSGEFGIDQMHQVRANNLSLSVIAIINKYSPRAHSRTLQKLLVRAASELPTCVTPRDVMEKALDGAVKAGATGGKFSSVDRALQLILGKHLGYAYQAPDSMHNWKAVNELTIRTLPEESGGDFPLELKDYAMAVGPRPPAQIHYVPLAEHAHWEDILTIIVRTQLAVFVRDCKQISPCGICDEEARAAGGIDNQLAVPLVGAQNAVFATVQFSFPPEQLLDREDLALWLSYAQSVAAALERAQEAEQRKVLSQLSALGNEIMQSPPSNNKYDPHYWCEDFLRKVVDWLQADGAHIRTLRLSRDDKQTDQYFLRAAEGAMADVLNQSRSRLYVHDGTFRLNLLDSGGKFINTAGEVAQFNKGIKATNKDIKVTQQRLHDDALARELQKIKSTAILPLRGNEKLLGSLVIDSHQEYFFTERRQQIVRAVAALAGSLAQDQRTVYYRGLLDDSIKHLDKLRPSRRKGKDQPGARLQPMLDKVTRAVGADVGSIFAWDEKLQKLILHTSHNWHQDMTGRAEYRRGEGWTGELFAAQQEIVLIESDDAAKATGLMKFREKMIPPEYRAAEKSEARIGVRLTNRGQDALGVMTLIYYGVNESRLQERRDFIQPFLDGAARIIAPSLEVALLEAENERTNHFFDAKIKIIQALFHGAAPQWQAALEVLRELFQAERVSFYHWRDNELRLGWRDQVATHAEERDLPRGLPLTGIVRDLILAEQTILISDGNDPRLKQWPNAEGIRSLCAVPAVDLKGRVRGMLEIVNRVKDDSQPAEFFGEYEPNLAFDIARSFGTAIERRDERQKMDSLNSRLATATMVGARGLMSAMVMHDLLAPFAAQRSTIDWLLDNDDAPKEERLKYLRRVDLQHVRAVELLQQAAHRDTFGAQSEKLSRVVAEARRFIESQLPANATIEVANNLAVPVFINLWSIIMALVNLLSNAIDAMGDDGTLRISTQLAPEGEFALIRIHNTGPSPSEEEISRFFQAGFSQKEKGSEHLGLGLTLARQAIETDGGQLQMRGTGDGVEVVVALRLAETKASQINATQGA